MVIRILIGSALAIALLAYAATFKTWVDGAEVEESVEEPHYPLTEVEELEYLYTLQDTRGVAQ